MAPKTTKINLKDRLDDGELDLSMSDLQEAPVKEIVALKKVTSLDLSNNRLSTLGKYFITMTSVVKLDLSKNLLTELPEDFGEMKQLKHLDLYSNQLKHLPLSFYQLKNLRWLDLKNNPLVPAVAKVAGLCIDAPQCVQCAKDVVTFFTQTNDQIEIEKARLEELHQADLEAEAVLQKQQQKKKEKKKALKAKKNKIKVEKSQDQIPAVEITPQNNTTHNNHSKSSPKIDKKAPRSIVAFIKSAIMFLILTGSVIFVLSSVKVKPAVLLKNKTVNLWGDLQNALPPTWRPWILHFENHVTNIHSITGKFVENAINTTNHFTKNEYVSSSVQIISEITTVITNETKKWYVLLSDQVLFLSTEIKKKFT